MTIRCALILACLFTLLPALPALAADAREWRSWCGSDPNAAHTLGWHFYCDQEEADVDAQTPPPARPSPHASAMERIIKMRRALEETRARAILEPNPENVRAYLALQQEALGRAALFSDASRRAVWASTDLDYTLKRPVGALAKQLWSEERRAERKAVLARLGERYGLIYLGSERCPGCRVFGPLLRAFALRHGIEVLAVSMTGGPIEGWPEAVADNGHAARLGLKTPVFPAVVLYDTRTKRAIPVSFGVVAEEQLAERIFTLTAREIGNDY